jgi:hypothetical protein
MAISITRDKNSVKEILEGAFHALAGKSGQRERIFPVYSQLRAMCGVPLTADELLSITARLDAKQEPSRKTSLQTLKAFAPSRRPKANKVQRVITEFPACGGAALPVVEPMRTTPLSLTSATKAVASVDVPATSAPTLILAGTKRPAEWRAIPVSCIHPQPPVIRMRQFLPSAADPGLPISAAPEPPAVVAPNAGAGAALHQDDAARPLPSKRARSSTSNTLQ